MDTEALDAAFAEYRTVAALTAAAKRRCLGSPMDGYVAELGLQQLSPKKAERTGQIATHFDELEVSLFQQYLLKLVATFEASVFVRLDNAVGVAGKTMSAHYPKHEALARAAARLVKAPKDDVRDLGGLLDLLAVYPAVDATALKELRLHRNHIAHGGRVGEVSRFRTVEEIHRVLVAAAGAVE